MGTRNDGIMFEQNEFGGRLRYVGRASTPEFWDEMWASHRTGSSYARAITGYLPQYLGRTLLKWVPSGSRILEAGCGPARFTVGAHARGYRAEGIDFAQQVVERLTRTFPEIPFMVGDVTDLEAVPDGSYDAVYSPGVCEHFEDGPEIVLQETFRILRPAGIAIVHTPYLNSFRKFLVHAGAFRRKRPGSFFQYAFSRKELAARLERVGFQVMEVVPFDTFTTLSDHIPGFARLCVGPIESLLESMLNRLPGFKGWGHCAIWVARKPE